MERSSIAYRVVKCPLGTLLVAGTPRGVCNIRFREDPARLVEELQSEVRFAAIEPDAGRLDAWVEVLLRALAGEDRELAIPLDVGGSQFQRRVWAAICAMMLLCRFLSCTREDVVLLLHPERYVRP